MSDEEKAQEREPQWGVVEIMGHTVRAGAISEITFVGAPMLRIEHPLSPPDGPPVWVMYSAGAIFSVQPCTREQAIERNRWQWRSDLLDQLPELGPGGARRNLAKSRNRGATKGLQRDYSPMLRGQGSLETGVDDPSKRAEKPFQKN